MDNLICTETMNTVHDSPHLTRMEKTAVLSRWEETYSALRVCFEKTSITNDSQSIVNCCRCEKCIRTMISLDMLGALSKYSVFPQSITRSQIRKCDYQYKGSQLFAKDVFHHARKHKRNDIAFDIAYASLRSVSNRLGKFFINEVSKPFQKVSAKGNSAKMSPGLMRTINRSHRNSRQRIARVISLFLELVS